MTSLEKPAVKLALVQESSLNGKPFENLKRMERRAKSASENGANIMIFPELNVTGYDVPNINKHAQPFDENENKYIVILKDIASKYKIDIVCGYPEWPEKRDSSNKGLSNNTSIYISCENGGTVIHRHYKTHLWGSQEPKSFISSNNKFKIFKRHGIKMALLICFEMEFPEITRLLKTNGVELILCVTAVGDKNMNIVKKIVTGRAAENQIHFAYCNFPHGCPEYDKSIKFCGQSVVVDPLGDYLVSCSQFETSVNYCVIKPKDEKYQQVRKYNNYMGVRKEELYHSLQGTETNDKNKNDDNQNNTNEKHTDDKKMEELN